MANKKNGCIERNCLEKGFSIFERNNYFCGKLMVDRDFLADQLYHMGKQWLHSSYLHGWGTVCGLKVDPHPHCPNLRVIVHPGLAVDCWGREIFVPNRFEVGLESYKKNGSNGDKPENLYICLRYMECETEPVPVFLDECGCGETCEPNRIRETFIIDVLTGENFEDGELDGYLFDRIESTGEIDIGTDTILHDFFDGTITIKTLGGTFSKNIPGDYANSDTVQNLIDDMNNDSTITVDAKIEDGTFVLTVGNQGDVIILEETGEKPFFSGVKIPAFNTEKGNKIIDACPDCKYSRIILATIEGYDKVEGNYLDSSQPEYITPAYTVDNLSYRKTLPGVELLNKLMIYNTFKNP